MENTNEIKQCKYCLTEIPKKAKICPNCKKKQGGKLKWVIIGVVSLIMIGVVLENDDNTTNEPEKWNNNISTEIKSTNEPEEKKDEINSSNFTEEEKEDIFDSKEQGEDVEENNSTENQDIFDTISTEDTGLSDKIIDVDISKCHVKYLRHEIVENMVGEKCIAIYYEFTNNSKDSKAFDFTISDKAFQNGIELDISLFHVSDESKDGSNEIKPGVTITVCSGFVLRDEESDVELEVEEWISFSSKPKDSMVLSIK